MDDKYWSNFQFSAGRGGEGGSLHFSSSLVRRVFFGWNTTQLPFDALSVHGKATPKSFKHRCEALVALFVCLLRFSHSSSPGCFVARCE